MFRIGQLVTFMGVDYKVYSGTIKHIEEDLIWIDTINYRTFSIVRTKDEINDVKQPIKIGEDTYV